MFHARIYNGIHRFWRIREDVVENNLATQDGPVQEHRGKKSKSNIRSCQKSNNEKDRIKRGIKKVRFNIPETRGYWR